MSEEEAGLSIVTIVLNGEKFIEETIQSVLSQENVNIEYIIIDGASTDGTIAKIKKYGQHISHFVSGRDGGIYNAINKGIALAKYPLIGLIHCGDYYEPNVLASVYKVYKETKADIIYGNIKIREEVNSEYIERTLLADHNWLKQKMSIYHPATFIKRSVYLKLGTYNIAYKCAADYDFLLNAYQQKCNFYHFPLVLATFRTGGMSSVNTRLLLKENFLIRKRRLNSLAALVYIIQTSVRSCYYIVRGASVRMLIGSNNYNKLKLAKSKRK